MAKSSGFAPFLKALLFPVRTVHFPVTGIAGARSTARQFDVNMRENRFRRLIIGRKEHIIVIC